MSRGKNNPLTTLKRQAGEFTLGGQRLMSSDPYTFTNIYHKTISIQKDRGTYSLSINDLMVKLSLNEFIKLKNIFQELAEGNFESFKHSALTKGSGNQIEGENYRLLHNNGSFLFAVSNLSENQSIGLSLKSVEATSRILAASERS